MTTIRRTQSAPTYAIIESPKKIDLLQKEILRLKPKVEVTLAGGSDLGKGNIIEWHPKRHFFVVHWAKKSENFNRTTEADSEVKAYFRVLALSTQIMFKCRTVRRVDEITSHYRIPEEIFEQQRRGALRVPVAHQTATLFSASASFEILDLSVNGARIKVPTTSKLKPGSLVRNCKLRLGKTILSAPEFVFTVTSIRNEPNTEWSVGGRFVGLPAPQKTMIKPFLMEVLRDYFKKV